MNERIRELIVQAGGIGHDDDGNELTPVLVGKDLEKFAELIVKECMEVIEDSEGYSQYFPHVTENIEKHFGVEE